MRLGVVERGLQQRPRIQRGSVRRQILAGNSQPDEVMADVYGWRRRGDAEGARMLRIVRSLRILVYLFEVWMLK